MDFKTYKETILCDLQRYGRERSHLLRAYFLYPGFQYTFWLRTVSFLDDKKRSILFLPYAAARFFLRRSIYKYGISIPYRTQIGCGLYIGHFGGIFVSPDARIGKNCNINHGVTIGAAFGGRFPGSPKIGDSVYFGPGCKVIGGIEIGNNVAIGANSVVLEPIPDNSVVAGIPGKIISKKGSKFYIVNTA